MSSPDFRLYSPSEKSQIPRQTTAKEAHSFLLPLMERGTSPFFSNLRTTMYALRVGETLFPLSVNDGEYENSYVCSPYGQYLGFAKEEAGRIHLPIVRSMCRGIIQGLTPLCQRGGMNKVIWVNNWLTSTNLYPPIKGEIFSQIAEFLRDHFPSHAIGFRSLHEKMGIENLFSLEERGFLLIPSRYVYLLDATGSRPFQSRMFRSDSRLLEETDYDILPHDEIKEEQIPRIAALYRALYIEKYSPLSPQMTPEYVQLILRNRILECTALSKKGRIDAIVGFIERDNWMTAPLFGYDFSQSQSAGLYRILSTLVSLEAKKRRVWLNQSSGAGSFKKLRRAQPQLEWSAVYIQHLPYARQVIWKSLAWTMKRFGIPVMKRMEKIL